MLTTMFAVGDTVPHSPLSLRAKRSNLRHQSCGGDCFVRLRLFAMTGRLLRLLGAAADLELLALVLHLRDRAEHFQAELAVRLAVDLHGALVLHHVAGRGSD